MKKLFITISYLLFLALIIHGCSSAKRVKFETQVDTTNKSIDIQKKQIFSINDIGVFASNNYDGARLNGFEKINDTIIKIIIKPENTPINNSAYYSFKTWSKEAKDFYFKFDYPTGYKHRYVPKLKQNGTWKTIDTTNIFKKDTIVTIKIKLSKEPILVAAQEIQNSKDVEQWYSNLIVGKENYVHLESFGKSAQGKNLPVLDIYKGNKKNKEIIILLTRQHPPEVTGYYAFQEFLGTVLNDKQLADNFLNKYRVLAFPIMNPDGVDLGHWRHNSGGVDLNRDWSKYRQPEIKQAIKYITKTLKENNSKIILGLDFHSTYKDIFYTNKIRENTTLPNFIEDWFVALETNIPDYEVNEASGNSTKPVSKGWFLYGHNAVGITYEIGDATPKERIKTIGRISAEQMMKILLN